MTSHYLLPNRGERHEYFIQPQTETTQGNHASDCAGRSQDSHNVGKAVRATSCFGVKQVWFSGERVSLQPRGKKYRLPREERMKGYKDVELHHHDAFFDRFDRDVVPGAIELRADSENLIQFEHPEKALYVFGPEDGGLKRAQLRHCHRFVVIPTRHCINLGSAVYRILYDRMIKRCMAGKEPVLPIGDILAEKRA